MTIESDIQNWNGKSAADIKQIYDRYYQIDDFTNLILVMMDSLALQNGATWLLKNHIQSIGQPSSNMAIKLYSKTQKLEHWQSKLHVLQCIPYLPIPCSSITELERFLHHCIDDTNKFVRAWAYNGLYLLANEYSQFRIDVEKILNMGLTDEPASVVVRIKKCLANGF